MNCAGGALGCAAARRAALRLRVGIGDGVGREVIEEGMQECEGEDPGDLLQGEGGDVHAEGGGDLVRTGGAEEGFDGDGTALESRAVCAEAPAFKLLEEGHIGDELVVISMGVIRFQ